MTIFTRTGKAPATYAQKVDHASPDGWRGKEVFVMATLRSSILKALFPIGALFALGACDGTIIIGGPGGGGSGGNGGGAPAACVADSDCAAGQLCVNGACAPGNPQTCNGQPSTLSCTQTGCPAGLICVPDPDPNACYPSSCSCDPATGGWVCTEDCGQGNHCVQPQQCGPNAECPPNMFCDASGVCVPVCAGTPEVCNGVDDDCNGVVDDGSGAVCPDGTMCTNGGCGQPPPLCGPNAPCPAGMMCDSNGVCQPAGCQNVFEVCNGIDDDCDGAVDEQDPGTVLCPNGAACVMGQCGTIACTTDADCGPGQACLNGVCGVLPQQCGPNAPCPAGQVCNPNGVCQPAGCVPKIEVCNGVDDDCDGLVDDGTGSVCPDGSMCMNGLCGGAPQPCGPNNPCPAGQVCNPNGVCSSGACVPKPETCNGLDDDCDGAIDDATPGTTLCPGGTCLNGACLIQCNSNANCPAGQMCVNGLCK